MLLPVRPQVTLTESLRQHERMIVEVVGVAGYPACEFSALFKTGVAFANKIGFSDSQFDQGVTHGWPGAFTHANRWNIWGFNQHHLYRMMGFSGVFSRNATRGQPAGCAAANDYHFANRL